MRPTVYDLAPPARAIERISRLPRGRALRLHLLAFWCRLRLTAAAVTDALRRFGRAEGGTDGDLVLAVAPPPGRPARIIDFVAARARLRP